MQRLRKILFRLDYKQIPHQENRFSKTDPITRQNFNT